MLGPVTAVALLTLAWLVAPNALISIDSAAPAKIAFNDNREPAGTLSGGAPDVSGTYFSWGAATDRPLSSRAS